MNHQGEVFQVNGLTVQNLKAGCGKKWGKRMWAKMCKYSGLALSWIFFSQVAAGEEIEFQASGVLTLSRTNSDKKDEAFNFQAFVKGDRWLIRTQPFDFFTNKSDATFESFQAGTDGTNTYTLGIFNKAYDNQRGQERLLQELHKLEKQLSQNADNATSLSNLRRQIDMLSKSMASAKPKPQPRNQATGEINLGVIPRFSKLDMIAPVWLALCSGRVLGNSRTNIAPGIFHRIDENDALYSELFVHADARNNLHFPHFLEFATFTNDAFFVTKEALKNPNSQRMLEPSAPFFLEARYEANSFQANGDLYFPKTFQIKKYLPSDAGGILVEYTILGTIEEISPVVSLTDFLPRVPEVAAISDHRYFRDGVSSEVRAFTTPYEWPSIQQVQSTVEYTSIHKSRPVGPNSIPFKRAIILILMSFVGIAAFVLARKTNKNKQTKINI